MEDYSRIIFNSKFDCSSDEGKKAQQDALVAAIDMYKFEMDMYWKRATYFSIFIGSIFLGFGTAIQLSSFFYAFGLSIFGFIISFIWYLANKGSKFWVRNWNIHVEQLEQLIGVKIFRHYCLTKKYNPLKLDWWSILIKPSEDFTFSVSKLSHYASYSVVWVWIVSFVYSGYKMLGLNMNWDYLLMPFLSKSIIILLLGGLVVLVATMFILQNGKTTLKKSNQNATQSFDIYEAD